MNIQILYNILKIINKFIKADSLKGSNKYQALKELDEINKIYEIVKKLTEQNNEAASYFEKLISSLEKEHKLYLKKDNNLFLENSSENKDFYFKEQVKLICYIAHSFEKNGNPDEHAKKLCDIFESTEEVLNYIIKFYNKNKNSSYFFHDACLFNIPNQNYNRKFWKSLLQQYLTDRTFVKILGYANIIEKKLHDNYNKENSIRYKNLQKLTMLHSILDNIDAKIAAFNAKKAKISNQTNPIDNKSLLITQEENNLIKLDSKLNQTIEDLNVKKNKILTQLNTLLQHDTNIEEIYNEFKNLKSSIDIEISFIKLLKSHKDKLTSSCEQYFIEKINNNIEKLRIEKNTNNLEATKKLAKLEGIKEMLKYFFSEPNSNSNLKEKFNNIIYSIAKKKSKLVTYYYGSKINDINDFNIICYLYENIINDIAAKEGEGSELLLKHGLRKNEIEIYLNLDKVNSDDKIPNISIDGNKLGHAGYYLTKLNEKDPRAAILGKLTGCCQSIGETGSACAIHGIRSENSGFYIVCKGDYDSQTIHDPVIAQSWVWLSKKGNIVFDSIETNNTSHQIISMITEFYYSLSLQLANDYNIGKVNIGSLSGIGTKIVLEDDMYPEIPLDYPDESYRDSSSQKIIHDKLRPYYIYAVTKDEQKLKNIIKNRENDDILNGLACLAIKNEENDPCFANFIINTLNQYTNDKDKLKKILSSNNNLKKSLIDGNYEDMKSALCEGANIHMNIGHKNPLLLAVKNKDKTLTEHLLENNARIILPPISDLYENMLEDVANAAKEVMQALFECKDPRLNDYTLFIYASFSNDIEIFLNLMEYSLKYNEKIFLDNFANIFINSIQIALNRDLNYQEESLPERLLKIDKIKNLLEKVTYSETIEILDIAILYRKEEFIKDLLRIKNFRNSIDEMFNKNNRYIPSPDFKDLDSNEMDPIIRNAIASLDKEASEYSPNVNTIKVNSTRSKIL